MKTRNNFTERVLSIVFEIPRGETLSYREVAERAGSPNAYRAVGSIMRRNHNPHIPCHRVIYSGGKVGEYNALGGSDKKRELLEKEGAL